MKFLSKLFSAWSIAQFGPGKLLLVLLALGLLVLVAFIALLDVIMQLVIFAVCVAIVVGVLRALVPVRKR